MSGPEGYQVPPERREGIGTLLERLGRAEQVVVTTHVNADGDGAGCEVALARWVRARGGEAWIVNPTPFPSTFAFLLRDHERDWLADAGSERASELCADADLVVVVDTAEVSRIGRVKPLIDTIPAIVVDHHPESERPIPAEATLRDEGAAATGELLHDLFLMAGEPWTEGIVDALYVAILTDTGGFRFRNTTPNALRVAAELVARGADPEGLHAEVYEGFDLRRFRLMEVCLGTLELDPSGRIAWMSVPVAEASRLGATSEDLDGFVDLPRSLDGVEVAILFRELDNGDTKVSLRAARDGADVNRIARAFGGGGHLRAAGAIVGKPLYEARVEVIEAVREALEV